MARKTKEAKRWVDTKRYVCEGCGSSDGEKAARSAISSTIIVE